jgi:sugar phosphate permease
MLGIGTFAQAATSSFLYGMPMLVPALRSSEHLTLVDASLVVTAPIVGLLLTLIAWGTAADRCGERVVMVIGLGLAALLLVASDSVHGAVALCVLLALAGGAAASVNAASGRMVMGWFSARERGLAMGTRQTAQPIGVAIAALTLPPMASQFGLHAALLLPAGLCAVAALALVFLVADPVRRAAPDGHPTGSPYRPSSAAWRGGVLWRVHAASTLLVVPQFAVATFTLVYLVGQRHWDVTTAGRMIFCFQLAGAAGRILSGIWSDMVGSRLGPMRQLGAMSAALMVALALGAWSGGWWIIGAFALGALVTVADNGLAYTAVAEFAGQSWSGRALGMHNTWQNVAAMLTAPLLALLIGNGRYALGFAVVALFPLLAIPLTPVRTERLTKSATAPSPSAPSSQPPSQPPSQPRTGSAR